MAFPDHVRKEMQDRFSAELVTELDKLHTAVFGKPKPESEDDPE
jgi:hypothetical protein